MHINFHIRSHELIERDFPHFPIRYLMHNFNPNIRSPLLCKHSQPFPKINSPGQFGLFRNMESINNANTNKIRSAISAN